MGPCARGLQRLEIRIMGHSIDNSCFSYQKTLSESSLFISFFIECLWTGPLDFIGPGPAQPQAHKIWHDLTSSLVQPDSDRARYTTMVVGGAQTITWKNETILNPKTLDAAESLIVRTHIFHPI